jgi:crotonobetainyl-CoA:carnitine CoA-transferase CaiB-like acyl-CoA transferase
MTHYPFSELKVVELASVLAGPAVGMFFAELGAQVVKIENSKTGGDMTRSWKIPNESQESTTSAYFFSVNWHKKHVFLDLTQSEDQADVHALIQDADIVISNFKPSSALKMRVDAATLQNLNPRLIFAQLNAFADPEDETPAFDMVLQAEAGFLHINGEPNRPPVKMPVALIDLLAGHQLKEAILIALLHRERSGKGCMVSTSLMESALASLGNQASNYLNTGYIPCPMGTQHPNIAPYGDVFTCADGQPVVLAVGTQRQFIRLCEALNMPEMIELPEYKTNSDRVKNRGALIAILAKSMAQFDAASLMEKLKSAGVPAGRIRNMEEVMQLPAAQAMVLEEEMNDGKTSKRLMTNAFKIGL